MQVNVNLHLTHGISHIQVINLALNMQNNTNQLRKQYISNEIDQNALKTLNVRDPYLL